MLFDGLGVCSMSVSSNSNAGFINFTLKKTKQKVSPDWFM